MKQTLHWNVSGIPAEARDAARAAATKEGLSVGDWLTRRILSDRGTGNPAPPPSDPAGADAKPQGARLARLEGGTEAASQRLDEALRMFSKRIEVSERAQNEAQRTLSAVASEIQAATREQTQVLARLWERIDRVEKNSDTAPLREAVRGLHQGVARLTEQIAKTTTDSASQVAVLATSVEAMAVKIASVRDESVRLERVIEERLDALSERVGQMEERVQTTPNSQQILESRIDAAEQRMREAFSQHVAAVERNFGTLAARLDDAERTRGHGHIQETIATLSRRFETAERRSKETMATLQSYLTDATARIARLEMPGTSDAATQASPLESAFSPLPADARGPASGDDPTATPRPEASTTRGYLEQARRAAQAAADPTAYIWQGLGVAGPPRERSHSARLLTQAFLLVLVMCTGFLLMQYFGPQPGTESPPKTGDARELELKAEQGVTGAELLLGLKYADGEGVDANNAEAARWLERAAQKGQALAQYRLGVLYEKGLGVAENTSLAADWYAKAAELGNLRAMHNLAVIYANGAGRETNFTEAARWFRSAAEHGLADSQFNLAVLYERGLGVKPSLTDAFRWYSIAAAQGDTESGTRIEALLSQIPAAERDVAGKEAEAFKPAPAEASANEAPSLSQALK